MRAVCEPDFTSQSKSEACHLERDQVQAALRSS